MSNIFRLLPDHRRHRFGTGTVCGGQKTPNGTVKLRAQEAALVHDSKLTVNDPNPEATHRPILYDSGRPSSVI